MFFLLYLVSSNVCSCLRVSFLRWQQGEILRYLYRGCDTIFVSKRIGIEEEMGEAVI